MSVFIILYDTAQHAAFQILVKIEGQHLVDGGNSDQLTWYQVVLISVWPKKSWFWFFF